MKSKELNLRTETVRNVYIIVSYGSSNNGQIMQSSKPESSLRYCY